MTKILSDYETRIQAYIDIHDCKTGRVEQEEVDGKLHQFPVYRLPLNLLTFNVKNGRFAAQLNTLENKLGKLKEWDLDHRDKIKEILIEADPDQTDRLKDELLRIGQEDSGIITAAGVVINGNRRMAILMSLYEEKGEEKYNYLDVIKLPSGISEIDIYKIEAKKQYARDFREPYGPINTLLKIKEGVDSKIPKTVLAVLLGRKEKEINEDLKRLELLEDYSKYRYGTIDYARLDKEGIGQHFIDMQNNLTRFMKEGGTADQFQKWVKLHYAYIKEGASFHDIRDLGRSDGIENAKESCFDALDKYEKGEIDGDGFKDLIKDANEEVRVKKRKELPLTQIRHAADIIKKIREEKVELNREMRSCLQDISNDIKKILGNS